jgi:hypothetical protein
MNTALLTTAGISLLIIYGLTKIFEFYGIGINVYGSYMAFYIFLLISVFVLPNTYHKVNVSSLEPAIIPP